MCSNAAHWRQAEQNLYWVKEKLEAGERKNLRRLEKAPEMVGIACAAAMLGRKGERFRNDQFELGLVIKATHLEAPAARVSVMAEFFRAEANWRLSIAELQNTVETH